MLIIAKWDGLHDYKDSDAFTDRLSPEKTYRHDNHESCHDKLLSDTGVLVYVIY